MRRFTHYRALAGQRFVQKRTDPLQLGSIVKFTTSMSASRQKPQRYRNSSLPARRRQFFGLLRGHLGIGVPVKQKDRRIARIRVRHGTRERRKRALLGQSAPQEHLKCRHPHLETERSRLL